jgi:hypothetical protein
LPSFDAIGTYEFTGSAWVFTLLKVDSPDETDSFGSGDLAIDGTTFNSFGDYVERFAPPGRWEWIDEDGGPYTGVVIGTLVGGTTGNSYTVGFTEEGSG